MRLTAAAQERSGLQTFGIFMTGMAAAIALLFYGRAFCITVVVSLLLALMLEPVVRILVRAKVPRSVSAFIVCSAALFALYLAGFGLYKQLTSFSDEMPDFSTRLNVLVDRVALHLEKAEKNFYRLLVPKRFQTEQMQTPPPQPPPSNSRRRRQAQVQQPANGEENVPEVRIREERSPLMSYVASYVSSFYNTLLMMSFVPFLVYFMLSWGDHVSRTFLEIFSRPDRPRAGRSWPTIANIARAYVVGNFILGMILAVVSCLVFWSWHLPYWPLVGVLSGFLSLVPYVGLPLAMIPAVISALLMYDAVTPYVVICLQVGVIHLLALNLLYPAVVGARVHLNPLAVTLALMFWATIWGAIGLVLAIPLTAALKAYLDNTESLQAYGRLLGDQHAAAVRHSHG